MRLAVKLSLVFLVLIALPAAIVSRDCTSNRLVLANDASGPVHVSVVVREEGLTVWSGRLDSAWPSLIPFEMSSGEGHFAVEVWRANDRMTQSEHGYVFPFDAFTHFIMVSDSGVSYTYWEELETQASAEYTVWDLLAYGRRRLFDEMSCADKRLWQAIAN